jgi:putative transposase
MSKPRKIVKGTTYLLTRRCVQRKFLLTPSAIVRQVFLYCLAYAAKKFGILVHAVCVMANHYHLVITDVDGKLPKFAHWLHEFVAKCLNIHYDREESFWAPGPYSAVELTDRNDMIAKVVYALQNPVQAGLVGASKAWPGLCSRPEDMLLGTTWTAARPNLYFSPNGSMPETATLTFTPPPSVEAKRFVGDVDGLLEFAEAAHREKAASEGKRFMGAKAIRRQHPEDAPKTRRRKSKGDIRPTIACADKWRRIAALRDHASFQQAYREARQRWKDGDRETIFPHGTYLLRHTASVRCAPPG